MLRNLYVTLCIARHSVEHELFHRLERADARHAPDLRYLGGVSLWFGPGHGPSILTRASGGIQCADGNESCRRTRNPTTTSTSH